MAAAGLREIWVEGQAFLDLAQRQLQLAEQKEAVEAARKVGSCPALANIPCLESLFFTAPMSWQPMLDRISISQSTKLHAWH